MKDGKIIIAVLIGLALWAWSMSKAKAAPAPKVIIGQTQIGETIVATPMLEPTLAQEMVRQQAMLAQAEATGTRIYNLQPQTGGRYQMILVAAKPEWYVDFWSNLSHPDADRSLEWLQQSYITPGAWMYVPVPYEETLYEETF